MGEIKKFAEIKKIAAALRKRGKKIVFTNGCFDILHYGHIKYLMKCRRLGDVLIIGLNSDSSVREIKGRNRPLTGEKERAAVLAALAVVDYVIVFPEPTPKDLIEAVNPDIVAKGGDWKKSEIVGRRHLERTGGRVVRVPFVRGYSTSKVIKKIKRRS